MLFIVIVRVSVTKEENLERFVESMASAMDNQWSSPKFITCPNCNERYDDGHKRRLIDTCGHPRCYSCLFVDKPCPLCKSKSSFDRVNLVGEKRVK